MAKILGLDLGTNSIGWALLNTDEASIVDMGCRIFPMGVENLGDGEGEISKNAARTGARGIRRQHFRRRLRKKVLLKLLSENGMCPLTSVDFEDWKSVKKFPSDKLREWFALNPYELRSRALKEALSLMELGRIFYHLIQRRGFQSNSRKGGKADGAIFKGIIKEGKTGIDETVAHIQEGTLGNYLYSILPKNKEPFTDGLPRVRNRYTTRDMYTDEFDRIWDFQSSLNTGLSDTLRQQIGGRKHDGDPLDGVLFHQRPLQSQKTLVGKCTFEPSKTKCPKSAIVYELFTVYQWVNTVECNGVKLSGDQREKIAQFLLRTEKCDFSRLRKLLGRESAQFKFNYKDQDKITGTHTISNLSSKKFFGESWFSFSEKEREDIWHTLYFFDSKTRLKEYAMSHWHFDAAKADAIANFHLKDKYGNLSRKAIQHILPFLKEGFTYDTAVVLGGIRNVFGARWNDLKDEQRSFITDNVPEIMSSRAKGGFIGAIRDFLKTEFGVTETASRKLYHHSASIQVTEVRDFLPTGKVADAQIQSIRNPVVITALFELRTLLNSLIKEYGPIDEIKIEMARELKASRMQRNKMRNEQQRLERENDRVKKRLLEEGQRITHTNMLLYKLWEECKNTCPYTGRPIPLHKLFSGEVQIEHIHPWSRSLNDSFANKTLCYADENRLKGDRTPYEFYGGDEQNWSAVKERALKLFSDTKEYPNAYKKFQRFVQQKFDDDFTSRQLNDTRYISREAKNYLMQVCAKVTVLPGQMTANLRQKWGLDNILNEANTKNRADHRHHAIDALVVACGTMGHLQELSRWNSYNRAYDLKEFPLPWPSFRFDAERATDSLLVSHRQSLKAITVRNHVTHKNGKTYSNKGIAARGQLHKEFSYGRRKPPGSENESYHIRKGVETIKTRKHIENVVDEAIRELIMKRVQELGGFKNDTIPPTTFFTTGDNGKRIPQLFLPNRNGSPVPILKIRMKETMNKAKQVRRDTNQFVNPRNNHHVVIFEQQNGKLDKEVISLWEVVERKKQGLTIVSLPVEGRRIIETFSINDMFLLYKKEEEINWIDPDYRELSEYLYKVQKVSGADYFMEICFRKHNDSRDDKNAAPDYVYLKGFGSGKTGWETLSPIKVRLSISGKIERKTDL